MDVPSRERWQRIAELFDAALDLPAAERPAWLREACGSDAALHGEVVRLLESVERPDELLDGSAADFAAELVAHAEGATAGAPSAPVARVGAWRIVGELGRGGMGTVYLAERDEHFRQRAALKVVRRGLHGDEELVGRFLEERQILASLEHAGIARLLDGGLTPDGSPWFAMEFVEGEPITAWCDANRRTVEERLELFCAVCDAVHYAHRRHVVHRDLKPSNILVRVDGVVKLLDFGIAKLLAPDGPTEGAHTRIGVRLLTPEYASPEQIRGEPVSPASDVYSLGVLLYELLTGRRPYRVDAARAGQLEQAVLTQDPPRPSTVVARTDDARDAATTPDRIARARDATPGVLRDRLRGGLDDIVLAALAKDPRHRYSSADALARDVRRNLEGLPVLARRLRSARSRRTRWIAALLVGAVLLGVWIRSLDRGEARATGRAPVLAVGWITDYRDAARTERASVVADLLATNLARVPPVRMVSPARLGEVVAQLRAGEPEDAASFSAAAGRVGASMLIDGALYPLGEGELRLDLRRIDLASGAVLAAHSVTARTIFAVVDSGTARLASDLGARGPDGSVADVTTRSEAAYRFYEAGLRSWYRGDAASARGLFEAALAEDSTLAMAAYYLAQADPRRAVDYLRQALRMAPRAGERERLFIEAEWLLLNSDRAALPKAETLATRYPLEFAGQHIAARARIRTGDLAGGIDRLRAVVTADSVTVLGADTPCRRCSARREIYDAYLAMDSSAAAEREARIWTAVQPDATEPWRVLAESLLLLGRAAEARDAYRRAAQLDPALDGRPDYVAIFGADAADLDAVDRQLRDIARSSSPDRQSDAFFYLAISLRRQGRFTEAIEMARAYRALAASTRPTSSSLLFAADVVQALVDGGRFGEAAALADSMAALPPGQAPLLAGSGRAGALVNVAVALAHAGDTTRLAALADTIRDLWNASLYADQQRRHHFVRGLLLARRGRDDEAAAEFRAAVVSRAFGDARVKYELASALVRLGRGTEAVAVLQPVLRAPFHVANRLMTTTQLEELLATAWDAAGVPDSAAAHYRNVLDAWQRAEPALEPRVARIRARVAALDGPARSIAPGGRRGSMAPSR